VITDNVSTEPVAEIGVDIYQPPSEYPKVRILPPQYVPTFDGKRVAVRVTLPADRDGKAQPGPFPVIVTQSGYNINLLSTALLYTPGNLLLGVPDSFIVRRGYAQVAVDTRGSGMSEGAWELLDKKEQQAMGDVVRWAKVQPWSNGKLGVAGVSYMAITSLFAAQQAPEAVDAVFASLPMGDAMRGTVGIGGMLNGLFMSTWLRITQLCATQNLTNELLFPQLMDIIMAATEEHAGQVDKFLVPLVEDAMNGDPLYNYNTDYWTERSPITHMDKVKAPTFILGALHDLFQRDEPLLYEILKNNDVDRRLVIYNGSHFINFVTSHIGVPAVPPVDLLLLQWFDKHLKGKDTGIEQFPEVVQYVKNYPTPDTPQQFRNDSYASASAWPHPLAHADRWYLRQQGGLSQTPPDGDESGPTMHQPPDPVTEVYNANGLLGFHIELRDGTLCSRSFDQWTLGLNLPSDCIVDGNATQQQRVVFESEPMAADYYINGPIMADIWIDSTVQEAVVSVQVEEVSERQALTITNGQLLASGRMVDESRSRFLDGEMIQPYHYFTEATSQPLVPGEVVKMQVEIFPTSAIIRRGNRLRIAISPSNQAEAMLSYPRQAKAAGGVTTIHMSPQYPSSIVLPIVPTSALN